MIKLTAVTISKYKSIQTEQEVAIEPDITTIVGMNESGKTAFLTALAKTNYFEDDDAFKFNLVEDYPRKDLIDFQDAEKGCDIIRCEYAIGPKVIAEIEKVFGQGVFTAKSFGYTCRYKAGNPSISNMSADQSKYLKNMVGNYSLSAETAKLVKSLKSIEEISEIEGNDEDEELTSLQEDVAEIIQGGVKSWENKLTSYIYQRHIRPKMPKYLYFDDYYPLPGKISINRIDKGEIELESDKTSKALFDFAGIDPKDILESNDNGYEKFVALLEASANKVTKEIFKYWSTNGDLDIDFKIQDKNDVQGNPERFLDIRVKNNRYKITLPLDRRSKGFNWFFSFIIWFNKIQADPNSDYILLLDEPGLNLHASAQADLLRFFEDLSENYQIIYTTHSPFMVEADKLHKVRTCFETDEGTVISDSTQEKDPNTLFPLQAALGYDIAQNLFISKNNLLVEGPADLLYLSIISNLLEAEGRSFLKEGITVVPVGGLDKVTTFISLLRGSKLNVVCMLDTFTDQKGKRKVDNLVSEKIIKEKNIRFFNEFSGNGKDVADIEDLFEKEDYLKLFNKAFDGDHAIVNLADLDDSIPTIVAQVNKVINKRRFNHYRPANKLAQLGVDKNFFTGKTLDNFELMFTELNKLL